MKYEHDENLHHALTVRRDAYRKRANEILDRMQWFTDEWAFCTRMANLLNSMMIKALVS